ncbi:TPA: hypothetical protein HA278_06365 [Candidatus Woesearchaeota archaeon]|nr:hypothetical protein [Candidatus Woesearchaeota archaeon]
MAVLKNKYPKLKRLDLRKPKDVSILHDFVKGKGIKNKTLDLMLSQAKIGKLPNLLFDITLSDKEDITEVLPLLMGVGYNPSNVHLVWVLTNYYIAVKQNKEPERGRIVPDDILLKTHEGAAGTMWKFIKRGTPASLDGSVHVILGGRKHTVFWKDQDGNKLDGSLKSKYGTDRVLIKDFKYITLKTPGKNITDETSVQRVILKWIRENTPKTLKNKGMFGTGLKEGKIPAPLPQLYIDLDEVLVDFLNGSEQVLGKKYNDKSWKNSDEKKALLTKNAPNFFRDLNWKKDGKTLWKFIRDHAPRILSAYPRKWMPNAKSDKIQWIKNNLRLSSSNVYLVQRSEKQKFAISSSGQPNVLVDDHTKNIQEWRAKGGIGIVHRSASETISKLKKMGF